MLATQDTTGGTARAADTLTRHDQHGRYPQAETVDDFRHNLATVQARMAAACRRAGRDPASVRLLPVSKTKPESSLRLAHAAGCRMLGENKVQEAFGKWEAMQDLADLQWSVIGHLQTNKAKLVARFASEFQALDNLRVAEALDRRLQAEGRALDVFVQVNTSGEASKVRPAARRGAGIPPGAARLQCAARARPDDAGPVLQRGRARAPVLRAAAPPARPAAPERAGGHLAG